MSLKDWIQESNNIVFFGGAGVSTESNIPDFRSDNGLYKKKYPYRHGHAPGGGNIRIKEQDAPPEIERRAVDKASHERREIHRPESAHDDAEDNKQPRLNYIFRLAECENSDFQAQKICRRDYHRHAEVRRREHCDREREQGDGEDINDLSRNFQLPVLQNNPSFHQKSHAPKRCMAKNKPVRFGKIHTILVYYIT